MRNNDARKLKPLDGFIDLPLTRDIQMAGGFVQHQQPGLAVQGAGEDHTLFLATGEG
jgi:hypothetical protein